MGYADPAAVLDAHVRRFNAAVRSNDFSRKVAGFTPDAEMAFEGVPVGPFVGREAIAEAYATSRPPTRFACPARHTSTASSSSPTTDGRLRGED
jgi:hypothetical protein